MPGDASEILARLTPAERAHLRERLKAKQGAAPAAAEPAAAVAAGDEARFEPFPLSSVQRLYRRAWRDTRPLAGRAANVITDLEFRGPSALLPLRIENAMRRLIERHEMLRAVLVDDARQRILPEVPRWELAVADGGEEAIAATTRAYRNARTPAGQWPMFDATCFLLSGDCARLVVRHDALLLDGTGRGVFVGELLRMIEEPEAELPPLAITFREAMAARPRLHASAEYANARAYWLGRVDSFPPPPALPSLGAARGELVDLDVPLLPPDRWRALKQRAASIGVSASAMLLCAFAEVVAHATGGRPFTLPLVTSVRPPLHDDLERIIANFNTIHLVAAPELSASFEQRARALQRRLLLDLDHRAFSGFDVVREWIRRGGLSRQATLPIAFNSVVEYSHPAYARGAARDAVVPLFRPRMAGGALVAPYVALLPTIYESDDGDLHCKWQVAHDAFPEAADRLPSDYRTLLMELSA